MPQPEQPLIYPAMAAINRGIEAIAKSRRNTQQGYQFRSIDDVYNCLHGLLADHGIFLASELMKVLHQATEGRMHHVAARYRFRFVAMDGSSVSTEAVGEGKDLSDKAWAKSMSIASKYALLMTFTIPTQDLMIEQDNDYPISAPAAPKINLQSVMEEIEQADLNDPQILEEIRGFCRILKGDDRRSAVDAVQRRLAR